MRTFAATVLAFVYYGSMGIASSAGMTVILARADSGQAPREFSFSQTGEGKPGPWAVVGDATASDGLAIEQTTTDPTDDLFPLAIYRPIAVKDAKVSARFNIIAGTMQSAGVAFRLSDDRNYYVARASALEQRVDLYRVIDGKMERIAGTDAIVFRNRWHTLGVVAAADQFSVLVDDKRIFTVRDRTFAREGQVALWAESDNVTRFERLSITPLPASGRN